MKKNEWKKFWKAILSSIYGLVTVAAVSILISTLWLPILHVYGSSMSPTLMDGEYLVAMKNSDFRCGDVIALYYGNKLLVKRCIAGPGQWVSIDEEGNVYVDEKLIDEPYLKEKSLGNCDIEFPYQVPEDSYFVMGDNRAVSLDSRTALMGSVVKEQIVGRVVFCIWPLKEWGRR